MTEVAPVENVEVNPNVDLLASKLDSLFTEKELESNLELVSKMGLNNSISLADICELPEISSISSDPTIVKKAIANTKNLSLNKAQTMVLPNLPLRRNKIFVLNLDEKS